MINDNDISDVVPANVIQVDFALSRDKADETRRKKIEAKILAEAEKHKW